MPGAVRVHSIGGDILFSGAPEQGLRLVDVLRRVCDDHPWFAPGPRDAVSLVCGLSELTPEQALQDISTQDEVDITLVVRAAPIILASGSHGIAAWNAESERLLWQSPWEWPDERQERVKFSLDNSQLLIVSRSRVRVLDSGDGRLVRTIAASSGTRFYDAAFYLSSGAIVTSGSRAASSGAPYVRSWGIRAEHEDSGCTFFLELAPGLADPERTEYFYAGCISSSGNGQLLVGTTHGALFWRSTTIPGSWIGSISTPVEAVSFSPDDTKAVVFEGHTGITLWDTTRDPVVCLADLPRDWETSLSWPIFSPDGALLFSVSQSPSSFSFDLSIWSTRTGDRSRLAADVGFITSLVPLSDGKLISCGFRPGALQKDPGEYDYEDECPEAILRVFDPAGNVIAEAERPRPGMIFPSQSSTSFLFDEALPDPSWD